MDRKQALQQIREALTALQESKPIDIVRFVNERDAAKAEASLWYDVCLASISKHEQLRLRAEFAEAQVAELRRRLEELKREREEASCG